MGLGLDIARIQHSDEELMFAALLQCKFLIVSKAACRLPIGAVAYFHYRGSVLG